MKAIIASVFLYLAVPGSGQLVFDGLPFSTRAEFAALALIAVALANRSVRQKIFEPIAKSGFRSVLVPVLLLLSLVKLLTFAWYPFADGFDTCYRSIYAPLKQPEACEKSYEGPFLRRSDLGFDNTSRIDRTVDFGVHMHDWSLPFMNEYPRMGSLWLERFPFTATYGAVLRNKSSERLYVPIYGNGEMNGSFKGDRKVVEFDTASTPLSDRYEFQRLTLVEVPRGLSEFTLSYRFSDDDAVEPPDLAPPRRGPYATLKVGEPQNRSEILEFAQLRIRGWTLSTERNAVPDRMVALDSSGLEVAQAPMQERPDVASYVRKPALTQNGFNFSIPANTLLNGPVQVRAVYGEKSSLIGEIRESEDFVPGLPFIEILSNAGEQSSFTVWFDADRNEFEALAPNSRYQIPVRTWLLLFLLDAAGLALVIAALLALVTILRRDLLIGLGLSAAAVAVLYLEGQVLTNLVDSRGIFLVLVVSIVVLCALRFLRPRSAVALLPVSVVVAAHESFDHLERFHGSRGVRWWGRLLYYWRDSDWYATQGYARTVFLEGSLHGGESLFWFQAGPRYLAFATRSLLGEQDVLVGIITVALGFFSVFVFIDRFLSRQRSLATWLVGSGALLVAVNFLSDDLMATFGFVGSSEYPTWIVLFAAASFVVSTRSDVRTWPMVAFALALGYSIQLRPNQIGGAVLVFVAMLLLVDRTDFARAIGTISKMVVSFAAVVSFSLWHNLYYAESFVPFTANAGINYQFSWLDVLGISEGSGNWRAVASQLRFLMYWNAPGNLSWASLFWSAQLLWIAAIAYRYKKGLLLKARSLLLLIPFGYALPMLKYQMTSYYPRHLVVINLAFLLTALMAWPHTESTDGEEAQAAEQPATIDPAAVSAQSR